MVEHWLVLSNNFKFRVGNFHNNNRGFASWSSQTASRIESADLLVFQLGYSTEIHLGTELGFLCYVPLQTPQKGFYEKYIYV
jgi:hypothetical protein